MVAVPGFALTAIWVAAWWRDKRVGDKRVGAERVGDKMAGDDTTLDTSTAFGGVGGVFVLALTAVVLVSTSGSLTFALLLMPTLSFGVIFAALAWKNPWGKSRLHHPTITSGCRLRCGRQSFIARRDRPLYGRSRMVGGGTAYFLGDADLFTVA